MRYLLTVILVLALASPAMSECIPDQQVQAADDFLALPATSAEFTPTDCSTVDWRFDFCTTGEENGTVIRIEIDCLTTANQDVYEQTYRGLKNPHTIGPYNDWNLTSTLKGHLYITKVSGPGGDFEMMDLRAYDFKD